MSQEQPNNPLHGLTLEKILVRLQEHYGWEGLDREIQINCFYSNPSIKSSLKFLRRTQWARDKVEALSLWKFCICFEFAENEFSKFTGFQSA